MVIKLLQQSTFRRYAAIVLLPFFCCFRCVTVPLTDVINYVVCILTFYHLLTKLVPQWTSPADGDPFAIAGFLGLTVLVFAVIQCEAASTQILSRKNF